MIVLDAYAVLAYLRDEPAAGAVRGLLERPSRLSAVNAAEVVDQLVRIAGRDANSVISSLVLVERRGMVIEPLDHPQGLRAGQLRARHYNHRHSAVSLADCAAAALALSRDEQLATSDPALAAVVRAEGGHVHPLPDSSGRLP